MSNLPENIGPSILPVEQHLPQPSQDATALVRLVTDSLDPSTVTEVVDRLKAQFVSLGLPANLKRSADTIVAQIAAMAHSKEPAVWILNQPHPLASEAKIVRMYRVEDGSGVEVYSSDGKMFVRTFVPERCIRFFDEAMSEGTFIAFIEQNEADEEEEEEEPEPEPEQDPEPAPLAGSANGSGATT